MEILTATALTVNRTFCFSTLSTTNRFLTVFFPYISFPVPMCAPFILNSRHFTSRFSLFFPIWVQKCLLWGYYGVLNLAAMDWDPVTRATDFYWITVDKSGIVLLALWFVALLALGRTLFIRKEV